MSNEGELYSAAARASHAAELMRDELLAEAFRTLEESYSGAWRSTTLDQVAEREKLFLAINIVGKVRDHLTAVLNNGKLAAAEINELEKVAERRKRFGIV